MSVITALGSSLAQFTDIRNSVQTLVADKVANLGNAAAPPEPEIHLPRELVIPHSLCNLIEPALVELRLELDRRVERSWGASRRWFSALRRQNSPDRYLIHIPPDLARRPQGETLPEFTSLPAYFTDGDALYLFSEREGALHRDLRNTFEHMWTSIRKVSVKFVPWVDLESIAELRPEQIAPFLSDMFDLGTTPVAPQARTIAVADLKTFQLRLALFSEFSSLDGRNNMLEFAGLAEYKREVDEGPQKASVAVVLQMAKSAHASLIRCVRL